MTRITITGTDEYGDSANLGWFNLDATTEEIAEGQRWDGENHRGIISGLQLGRAYLYRTAGGRWAEHCDASREFNGPDRWKFLTDDEARLWLIKSQADAADDVLTKYFPETPEESGPGPQGGRPAVGPAISVAYPVDLLQRIDAEAKRSGVSRAKWLRQVAEAAVANAGS